MKHYAILCFCLLLSGLSCKKEEIVVPVATVSSQVPPGAPELHDIVFPSADTGFISCSGGQVLRTVNGGNSWTVIQVGAPEIDFEYLSFVNSQVGYVSGEGFGTRVLYKTTDGGLTWNMTGSSYEYVEIEFITVNTGYMLHYSFLYKTTNGGLSWTMVNTLSSIDYPEDLVFLSVDTGFMDDRSGSFYRTTNGGVTVSPVTISGSEAEFHYFAKTGRRSGLGFKSSSVMATSDGGMTWSGKGSWTPTDYAYARSANGALVAITGDQVFILSKDGGTTFKHYYDQNGGSILDDLKKNTISPAGILYCLGASGKIYKITF